MKQENFRSLFGNITDVPIDPIFGIVDLYKKDTRPNKIHLSAGVVIDEEGRVAPGMKAVKKAEEKIVSKEETKNYLAIDGDAAYVESTGRLIFGELFSDAIYGAQTVGGTGALRLAADFLRKEITSHICLSNPTWANHIQIFHRAGFQVDYYPYADHKFDFGRMYDHLAALQERTVVLLQPMCHNPTGVDPSFEEWKALSELFLKHKLIPFFDSAYQGFGDGLKNDTKVIKYFVEKGHECFVAHSYSKSMSLYNERVGALYIVMRDPSSRDKLMRNIRSLIRTNYSNPPYHGAHVAKIVLQDEAIRPVWESEVESIRQRVISLRKALADGLEKALSYENFDYIRKGKGFFCLLGLTKKQVIELREKHGIYTTNDSRINIAALSDANLPIIINAIKQVGTA